VKHHARLGRRALLLLLVAVRACDHDVRRTNVLGRLHVVVLPRAAVLALHLRPAVSARRGHVAAALDTADAIAQPHSVCDLPVFQFGALPPRDSHVFATVVAKVEPVMEDERSLRWLHAAFARVSRRMPETLVDEHPRQLRCHFKIECVRDKRLDRDHSISQCLLAGRPRERPHAECGEAAEVPGHGAAGEALDLWVSPELVAELEEHVCRFLVRASAFAGDGIDCAAA
jgi:hypothetical protein